MSDDLLYTVYYHTKCKGFYGRAIPIIATFHAAGLVEGVHFKIRDKDDAPEGKSFTVPCVRFEKTGLTLGQTTAILQEIGKQLQQAEMDYTSETYLKQYLGDITDVLGEYCGGRFDKEPERADKWMTHLDGKVKDGPFFCGLDPCVVDYYAYFLLAKMESGNFDISKYVHFKKWSESIKKSHAIETLINSGIPMLPPASK
jgi:hypothetical protein